MIAGVFDDPHADPIADAGRLDRYAVDLHRVDGLGEVGSVADDVNRVADVILGYTRQLRSEKYRFSPHVWISANVPSHGVGMPQ